MHIHENKYAQVGQVTTHGITPFDYMDFFCKLIYYIPLRLYATKPSFNHFDSTLPHITSQIYFEETPQ